MSYKNLFKFTVLALILSALSSTAGAATAELNYRYYCASCHGLQGMGDGPNNTETQPARPIDLTDSEKMSQFSDKKIIKIIQYGGAATKKSRMMPPFGYTLSRTEIRELKDYLRELCKCVAE